MSTQNPEVRTVRPIASGTGLDISSLMLLATLVSGLLFATLGNVVMGASMATTLVKLPIVVGTAAFNAIVVQLLAPVVTRASHRR